MNPKIKKLQKELSKNKEKISDLQVQNKDLEKQIRELENVDIIGMVREQGLTPEQLAELLRSLKNMPRGPEPVLPQPEQGLGTVPEETKEDNPVEQY